MAAYASWAKTEDPSQRTAPARRGFFARFERQVDPDGVLSPSERQRRAEAAQKAYMTDLAYRSSRARQHGRRRAGERNTMDRPSTSAVWGRIVAHEGETFTQICGGEFTYVVEGDYLGLDRTNQRIPRKHIEEALGMVPLPSTTVVHHMRAPSYIYAILMDDRIRTGDW